jgi:hypothetical protein
VRRAWTGLLMDGAADHLTKNSYKNTVKDNPNCNISLLVTHPYRCILGNCILWHHGPAGYLISSIFHTC